jgi:hypothetical protein
LISRHQTTTSKRVRNGCGKIRLVLLSGDLAPRRLKYGRDVWGRIEKLSGGCREVALHRPGPDRQGDQHGQQPADGHGRQGGAPAGRLVAFVCPARLL